MTKRPWTEGPWKYTHTAGAAMSSVSGSFSVVAGIPNMDEIGSIDDVAETAANARLIAQAPAMYEMLKRLEWAGKTEWEEGVFDRCCPVCLCLPFMTDHAPDCELDALLNAANPEGKVEG